MRVRVSNERCDTFDLTALVEQASREGLADYLLVGFGDDCAELHADDHYLGADEVVELLEASPAVVWPDGVPRADHETFTTLRGDDALTMEATDTIGLRALASLSRNKLPWKMRMAGVAGAADDWFERVFFRTVTAAYGVHGRRFGSAERGRRVADGVLRPINSLEAALYDCKAARDGYVMTADHERRLLEYAGSPTVHGSDELIIRRVIVVSSSFPSPGPHHPFDGRRAKFRSAGLDLSYVRAADVVAGALALRPALDLDTSVAQRVEWCKVLDEGLVSRDALLKAVSDAIGA
jgi:hypothetical protein